MLGALTTDGQTFLLFWGLMEEQLRRVVFGVTQYMLLFNLNHAPFFS